MTGKSKFFERAYALENPQETRSFYQHWAAGYDDELRAAGYASPERTAAAMAATVADVRAPLLDIGCGTGLSGKALRDHGFSTFDGTDFSAEMLAIAEDKEVYRKLFKSDLNDPIPVRPGDYTNFAAVGVFSPGHAPPTLIDSVVALLPGGGCFGFSLNDHALQNAAYEARIRHHRDAGTVDVAFNEYGDHLPAVGVGARIYVLRKR